MTVVEEIVFQKYSLLASHHLHGRIVFPCPIDFGFGHVTCFGQWNVGKHNVSEDLQCTYPGELALAPLVLATPWSEEEEMRYRTETQSAV